MNNYTVEFRNAFTKGDWDEDFEFNNLAEAVEYAAKASLLDPNMEHRILKVALPVEVMTFPPMRLHL